TSSLRLGLMVGANTFRNPGHTAKLATTLDHLSGGRAVLGIGGAWFDREHEAFGIPFGAGVGERLDRLDEAVMLMRRLLDGERFSHAGQFYS
ncbi:LLM class flavin-dependent oxidoreductase, partial [Burkholderia cenocepacia]|uniref:LLM class flavin-dependent oxidoreductase n=1 Tax=Burkholderia cenocepacia TaxID=95486 RepID=UPI000F5C0795